MSLSNQELTSYRASCHCGAVTFTVGISSLSDQKVKRCDCSICRRNGYLLIYPKRYDVNFQTGFDHMVSYIPIDKETAHKFCPTCGTSVLVESKRDDGLELCVNVSGLVNP
jgi:hypothetical protein